MIKLHEVHKVYMQGKIGYHALKDVSLYFKKGEIIAIYGPSGCGKTTLLNIIGGLDIPTSGDMVIGDKLTTNFTEKQWDNFRNHKIGFIFQAYNLIEHLPIVENVALSIKLGGISNAIATSKAIDLLKKVGLENHLYKLPGELSGGERQRVAIARALINDPDVILADEPTGALDMKTGTEIMNLIKSISEDKLVIIVTHNKKIAEMYSTRMIELRDGRVTIDTDKKDEKVKITNKREKIKGKLKFREAIRLALYNIRGKKWRTFLVAFGLSVGIVGLILVDAFFSSIRIGLIQQEQIVKDNPDVYIYSTIDNSDELLAIGNDLEQYGYFKEILYAPNISFTFDYNETDDVALTNPVSLEGIGVPDNSSLLDTFTSFIGDSRLPTSNNEFALSIEDATSLIGNNAFLTDDELWEQIKHNEYVMYYEYEYFPNVYELQDQLYDETCLVTSAHTEDELGNIYEPVGYDEVILGPFASNILSLRTYMSGFIQVSETEEIYCADYDAISWNLNTDAPIGDGHVMTLVGIFENDLFYEAQFTQAFINGIVEQDYSINSDDEEYLEFRFRAFIDSDFVDKKVDVILNLEDDGYIVFENLSSGLEFFQGIISFFMYILQFIFSSIIWIAIITGGLMLLLILYINVLERKREIGIIRAIGGTRKDVRIIYSGETTIIGLIAGVLSVIVSIIAVLIINRYLYVNYKEDIIGLLPFVDPSKLLVINFSKLAFAILGSIVIALISGLIPANIAARKKPIDALRND